MVTVDEADVFDLGAALDDEGGAFDFEVFDDDDRVAGLEDVAVGVAYGGVFFGGLGLDGRGGPLVGAGWADQELAVEVGVVGGALGAGGELAHEGVRG